MISVAFVFRLFFLIIIIFIITETGKQREMTWKHAGTVHYLGCYLKIQCESHCASI